MNFPWAAWVRQPKPPMFCCSCTLQRVEPWHSSGPWGVQAATGYNHPKGFVYSIGSNPIHGVTPYMGLLHTWGKNEVTNQVGKFWHDLPINGSDLGRLQLENFDFRNLFVESSFLQTCMGILKRTMWVYQWNDPWVQKSVGNWSNQSTKYKPILLLGIGMILERLQSCRYAMECSETTKSHGSEITWQ